MNNQTNSIIKTTVNALMVSAFVLFVIYSLIIIGILFEALDRRQANQESKKFAEQLSDREAMFASSIPRAGRVSFEEAGFVKEDSATFVISLDENVMYTYLYER